MSCIPIESASNRLVKVTSGLGSEVSVSYSSITAGEIYSKDSGSSYPHADLQIPYVVVSSLSKSGSNNEKLTSSFNYGGMKYAHAGAGMLGFRWQNINQTQTGLSTKNEYMQDYPFTGLVEKISQQSTVGGSNGVLSVERNIYSCDAGSNGSVVSRGSCPVTPGQYYSPYLLKSESLSYDLNGATLPTTHQAYTYDDYGNVTNRSSQITHGTKQITESVVYEYDNDTSNWLLGKLRKKTSTKSGSM